MVGVVDGKACAVKFGWCLLCILYVCSKVLEQKYDMLGITWMDRKRK